MSEKVLLEVKNLKKYFSIGGNLLHKSVNVVKAVDHVSFQIMSGETLGLVGESGCGKSTLGRSILRLIEPTAGQVILDGEDITAYNSKKSRDRDQLRKMRQDMQIIFQDPYASLNPRMTVGDIIGEPLDVFHLAKGEERKKRILSLLGKVGLDELSYGSYPHEFSGGQRQRIGIARALALNPKLIICDEPVSALDVSVRSQVLNLMQELQKELNLTYLFISHDLSVVKHISTRVAVMYLGCIVEMAGKNQLYEEPLHPYTKALLSAITIPDPAVKVNRIVIEGDVPSPVNPPKGCHFHPRCPYAKEVCSRIEPELKETSNGHLVACHLYHDDENESRNSCENTK